jgi:hypothetical protein
MRMVREMGKGNAELECLKSEVYIAFGKFLTRSNDDDGSSPKSEEPRESTLKRGERYSCEIRARWFEGNIYCTKYQS